jgi:CPA2 family monovalent cation:H+ antiporter-2
MSHLGLLRDLIVLLGLGVVVVLAFHRLRLPPIVGFLVTGVLCGPHGFGLISGVGEVESLAEVGVVLLLFTVGIEFSMEQMARMRTTLFAGGGLQVGLTIAATVLLWRAAADWRSEVFVGMLVALSSTAIVLRLLADRGETDAPHGRLALAILIFQDLCIVPMMLVTPFLQGEGTGARVVALVLVKAVTFVLSAILAARYVFPRVLHFVVATRKREIFLLAIVLLCLGVAWASAAVGLSLALGAFIAGLTIADSEYSHQALGEILPLREVFFSLFFVSIGMLFDVRPVLAEPLLFVGALVALVLLKSIVTGGVVWGLGHPLRVAVVAGLSLAQVGEFSFVLSRVGRDAGLLDERMEQLFFAVAVASMALTPALLASAPRLALALEGRVPKRIAAGRHAAQAGDAAGPPLEDHCIIVGYGLNGRHVARVLGRVGIPFVVVEINPEAVSAERRRGRSIIYGTSTRPEVLEYAGIHRARVLVVAISDAAAARLAVNVARRLNPRLHIIARSRFLDETEPLLALGTDEVVPEEFETSVEIFSRVLRRYLVPRDVVERLTHEIRQDAYEALRAPSDGPTAARGLDRFLTALSLDTLRVGPESAVAGRQLADSGLREGSGATVVAIQRAEGGEVLVNPAPESELRPGDLVVLLGRAEQISAAVPMVTG